MNRILIAGVLAASLSAAGYAALPTETTAAPAATPAATTVRIAPVGPASAPKPPALPATPPPTQESLHRLAKAAQVDLIHDSIAGSLDKSVDMTLRMSVYPMLRSYTLTAADKASVDGLGVQIKAMVDEDLSAAKIEGMFEQVYAKAYTQDEVNGLIAFYDSPVGRIFAAKQTDINTQVGLMIQGAITSLGMKVRTQMSGVVDKIRKEHTPPVAPKPPGTMLAKPAPAAPGSATSNNSKFLGGANVSTPSAPPASTGTSSPQSH